MGLSHKAWLGKNLMKHPKTQGMVTIQTKEELLKETDRVIQHNFQNIKDKHRWMIDLDPAAYAEMGCMETQHPISEIEVSRAKDKFVAK